MRRVNIYAESETAAFRKKKRMAGYVLELVDSENRTETTRDGWFEMDGTWNEVVMKAFIMALGRMTMPCEIHLHTQNRAILDMIGNNMAGWKEKGFRNAKGEPIRNAMLWQDLANECENHTVIPESGDHSFRSWMMETMKKRRLADV